MKVEKKLFFICLVFMLTNFSEAQTAYDSRHSNYENKQIFFISKDSVKIFLYSRMGRLEGRDCSDIYRIAKINKYFQFEGKVIDYYSSNNSIAAAGNYVEGVMNGEFIYYYENGNIKEKGFYNGNKRTGKWMYYFEKGNIQKVIDFIDTKMFLVECYSEDGKILAQEGNGKFEGDVSIGEPRNLMDVRVKGAIHDGLMSGRWEVQNKLTSSSSFMEYFDEGIFKEGMSESFSGKKRYFDKYLSSFESTHPMESLDYYTQADYCFFKSSAEIPLRYNAEFIGVEDYYKELKPVITKVQNELKDSAFSGWAFIKNDISKRGKIENIAIELSNESLAFKAKLIKYLYELDKWSPAEKDRNKIDYYRFTIVLIEGNEVVIPEELLFNGRSVLKED